MKLSRLSHPLVLIAFAALLSGASDNADAPPNPKLLPAKTQDATPKETANSQKQGNTAQPTAFEKSLIESLRAINDQQRASDEQNRANQKPWWIDPGLLVGIGALYTLFAAFQWWAIRSQVNLERPWIMFRPDKPDLWPFPAAFDPNNCTFIVPWNIINVGRSPAFLTRLVRWIRVVSIGQVPPELGGGTQFPNYIISSKSPPEDRMGSDLPQLILGPNTLVDLQTGKSSIWFYGIAEYRDTRGTSHHTRFCCRWYVENGTSVYDPVGPDGWTEYT